MPRKCLNYPDCFCFSSLHCGWFGIVYIVVEWRLFTDSSKGSLKAVLLHVRNKRPSIFIARSV